MTIQEAVKSGKWFRQKGTKNWWRVNHRGFIVATNDFDGYKKGDIIDIMKEDILADYEIKEEWYEGNFKKKYPNGVLCKVWDDEDPKKRIKIVTGYMFYLKNYITKFNTDSGAHQYAEPVKPEKAPAIIGDKNDT